MDTAGIDFGSTLTKVYWRNQRGEDRYVTVNGGDLPEGLSQEMWRDGIRRLRAVGIGSADPRRPANFTLTHTVADAVNDEIRLQAAGARLLMQREGRAPKEMLIASIGTGVSYTKVGRTIFGQLKTKRSPLGSCHGGGTILGLGRLIGARSFDELEDAAARGTPCDLLVKDQLPATDGTPLGELVIAHFWKKDASFRDKCASVFSFAAASIVKDLAVLTSIPFSPKEIVVVGKVSSSSVFRRHLQHWAPLLKKCRLHFPACGEYAAAVGAWADISK